MGPSQVALVVKSPVAIAEEVRDRCSIPGLGSSPEEGIACPLQYSCLEKPHRQRSLVGFQTVGSQRVRHDWVTKHNPWLQRHTSPGTWNARGLARSPSSGCWSYLVYGWKQFSPRWAQVRKGSHNHENPNRVRGSTTSWHFSSKGWTNRPNKSPPVGEGQKT